MIDTAENVLKYFREKSEGKTEVELFNNPKLSWLFDIWIAAKFGTLFEQYIQDCLVEVDQNDSQKFYDFKLHVNGNVLPFQATGALESERRRGAEYKKGESLFDQDYWKHSAIEPYEYVGRTIERKLKKYAGGASDINLVVYVNLFGFDEDFDDVYQHCKSTVEQFKSVWLFSSNIFGALYESESHYYKNRGWIERQS